MTFKNEETRILAAEVKLTVYSAFQDSPYTEQDLGRMLGVKQQCISNFTNPESERQPPLWMLARLPKDMARTIASRVLHVHALDVRDVGKLDRTNGTIADEIKELTVKLGRLAERGELVSANIPTLRKLCTGMKTALDKLELELDQAEDK